MLALALFILTFLLIITTNIILYSIYFALSNRKIGVNFLTFSWKILKTYKQITKQESGRVGKLYYLAYIFALLTVLSFVGAIISLYS